MGNFNSYCISPGSPNLQTATLLSPNGATRPITLPITAAELMIDEPGHVIMPVDRHTRHITAVKADEQLSPGKVYLLVPANRVHSKVTQSDITLINSVCKRSCKRSSSKVSPVVVAEGLGVTCHRSGAQWKPVLDPISEEPRGYVKYLTRLVR